MTKEMIIGIAIGGLLVWFVVPRVLPMIYGALGKGE